MPTRPRINIAGYHHIINRGVDQMNVFRHNEDKDMFLQIVNKTAMILKTTGKIHPSPSSTSKISNFPPSII